ncbi:hypothetical protein OSB04_020408 [Centaurea solstitialis]|uniref:Uncharacterized protein n=1 Tax=Centaurea solstitialis TaxID=347529 RepID=A0AA38WD90_9ASTR|nr:hypothetical protein OSB04_020408 [Centaurea solstitialis]
MEMQKFDNQQKVVIEEDGGFQSTPPSPVNNARFERFYNYPGILYLLYVGALLVMYPSLIGLAQLKFENKNRTPFETNTFFANMAVVSYIIAIPIAMILFYINIDLENSVKEHLYYKILINVFWLSAILAPFSFVMVLFIPHRYNWIGYFTICVLLLVIIASNLIIYKSLLGKGDESNLEALQPDKTTDE